MARRSPQTQAKRQREVAKAEKRQEKAEKKALRKLQKSGELGDPDEASMPLAETDPVAGLDSPGLNRAARADD